MRNHNSSIMVRECPVCHKKFIAAPNHVYYDKRTQATLVCSWSCVRESERLKEASRKKRERKRHTLGCAMVRCVETGEEYRSSYVAGRELKLSDAKIRECCRGERETWGGYHWEWANK